MLVTEHGRRVVPIGGAAVTAGVSLIMTAVLYTLAAALMEPVIDWTPELTISNVAEHELLVRLAALCFTFAAVLDIVVAWALYVVLRPIHRDLAMLAAWLRVVWSAAVLPAIGHLVVAARKPDLADASIQAFDNGWTVASLAFGSHLVLVGALLLVSGYAPHLVGVLVLLAGVTDVVQAVAWLVVPTASPWLEWIGSIVYVVGELTLIGWLLLRGRKLRLEPERVSA